MKLNRVMLVPIEEMGKSGASGGGKNLEFCFGLVRLKTSTRTTSFVGQ